MYPPPTTARATAEVATDALDELVGDDIAPIVASIDADPFFDFTQERPQVEFDDDVRIVRWPENEFRVARFPNHAHDLVLLAGVEPHLRYATFADAIIEVATALGCEAVVTIGAAQLGPIARDETRKSCVDRMLALLRQAHAKGCKLVVFPGFGQGVAFMIPERCIDEMKRCHAGLAAKA